MREEMAVAAGLIVEMRERIRIMMAGRKLDRGSGRMRRTELGAQVAGMRVGREQLRDHRRERD